MTYFASLFSMVDQDINTEMIILIVNTKIHMIKLRLLKSLKVSWPKNRTLFATAWFVGYNFDIGFIKGVALNDTAHIAKMHKMSFSTDFS